MGEIGSLINDPNDTQLEEISKGLAKFTKKVTPRALSMLVKKLTGIDCAEIVKELGEHAISSFEEEVLSYKARKDEFGKIKEQLERLVESQSPRKKPVIFIVDELDRCRPDYAVEVLEKIKHLFSVNNLIFVLAVDKEQLCHAIKGYYGSSELNASEYLRRFIDIEYNLGCSNYESIVQHFFEYFGLILSVPDMEESNSNDNINKIRETVELIALISKDQRLSMRQVEKWIAYLRLIDTLMPYYIAPQPQTTVLLTFLQLFHSKIYQGIKDKSYSLPKLIQDTKDLFPNRLTQELGVNTPINPILSVGLCTLYLLYYQALFRCKHPLSLNENGVRQKKKEVLDPFFSRTSEHNEDAIIDTAVESFNLSSASTAELVSIVDKLGGEMPPEFRKIVAKYGFKLP